MRKSTQLLCLLMLIAFGVHAQQEAQFTQFMYNKLTLNPAYAGSAGMPCISCIHRSQWIGFDGAPSSQVINFHMPAFSKRVGLGASLAHDKIGPINSYTASLMYAYRMKIKKGTLSIGVRGTMRAYQLRWAGLAVTEEGDEDIPTENTSKVSPNFGIGFYYDRDRFYFGFSAPNIINNDLSFSTVTNGSDFGRVRRHFYAMAGYVFDLGETVKLKPALLVKYVSNAPLDLDLNATFIFVKRFWTGLSYRMGGDSTTGLGESIDLLVQYQINPEFRAGVAYDFTLSKLRESSSGTVEVQLDYCFGKDARKKLTNPRFF